MTDRGFIVDGRARQVVGPDGRRHDMTYAGDGRWQGVCPDAVRVWQDAIRQGQVALERNGRALYGDDWLVPLADDLQVSVKTVGQWMAGKLPLMPDHSVWRDITVLVERRCAALLELLPADQAQRLLSTARAKL